METFAIVKHINKEYYGDQIILHRFICVIKMDDRLILMHTHKLNDAVFYTKEELKYVEPFLKKIGISNYTIQDTLSLLDEYRENYKNRMRCNKSLNAKRSMKRRAKRI